jgi:hypothetical protein
MDLAACGGGFYWVFRGCKTPQLLKTNMLKEEIIFMYTRFGMYHYKL